MSDEESDEEESGDEESEEMTRKAESGDDKDVSIGDEGWERREKPL